MGVADDVSPTGELERTGRALEVAMVLEALDDAGLSLSDVDGVCHAESAVALAEYLGIHPRFTDSTMTGGSSYEVHARARRSRHRRRPVRRRGERLRRHPAQRPAGAAPRGGRSGGPAPGSTPWLEWEMPYGLRMPMGPYALAASRHMAEFGTTSEQLAQIAVSTPRQWAR